MRVRAQIVILAFLSISAREPDSSVCALPEGRIHPCALALTSFCFAAFNTALFPACDAVFFKVKKTTAFKKIFDAYLQRVGKAPGSLRFMFDGARVQDTATPAELGMEDEDTIDAAAEQTGGQ
jgi:hypothetical protein